VVVGIAGMEDMKKVGKTGGYALLYFEIVSSVALIVGLTIVNVVQPGAGMNIDPATLDTKGVAAYTKPGQMQSTTDFLLNIIPSTVIDAFAKGEILQVLLFAVLFGFALHRFGGRGTLVFDWIEKSSHVLFVIVGYIMRVAPLGAFGAMAFTIGKYAAGSLLSLGKLMGTFYLTCLVFILVVLGLVALAASLSAVGRVPVAGLALSLGIDGLMWEARALTKLSVEGVATVVVGKSCNDREQERMNRVPGSETDEDAGGSENILDSV